MTLEKYNEYIDGIINTVSEHTTSQNIGVVKSINAVCGFYGVANGNEKLYNWNDIHANIDTITQYWCIYQSAFKKVGNAGAKLPEIHNSTYSCSGHCSSNSPGCNHTKCRSFSSCVQHTVTVQSSCIGHKLPVADFRNQAEKFPLIKKGTPITFEFFNQLAEIINFQIAERCKSNKYKTYYTDNNISSAISSINNTAINTVNANLSGHIDYDAYMSQIITKLSCMQTNTEYDNSPTGKKFVTLKNIKYAMQGSGSTEFELDAATYRQIKPSMIISKDNINAIVNVIKEDLNDCICYSDCNGYSVCYCYGNCNHY